MKTLLRLSKVIIIVLSLYCSFSSLSQPSKCIDLGVGIDGGNNEYTFIDFFKDGGNWVPNRFISGSIAPVVNRNWIRVTSLDEFKVVNGNYWNYDRNWNGIVSAAENSLYGDDWADTKIDYWDMMMDQGRVRADGYPTQIPLTIYEYQRKSVNPSQPIDLSRPITIGSINRRCYFPDGMPTTGWILKWKGKGRISFEGITAITSTSAGVSIVNTGFTFPAPTNGNNYSFTNTTTGGGRIMLNHIYYVHGRVLTILNSDPLDPIRDVALIYPGMESLYDAGEIINPLFSDKMSKFKTLRYMGYNSANDIQSRTLLPSNSPFYNTNYLFKELTWDERTKPDWYKNNNGNGGTHEVIVAISNKTKTDPWVCIPYCAGKDYVVNMIRYYMANLDLDRTLYLELGNELWNFGSEFKGYYWLAGMKQFYYPGTDDLQGRGYRINDIFSWVAEAAGRSNMTRINRVIGAQKNYFDLNNRTVVNVAPENWESFATTWYFGLSQDPLSTNRAPSGKIWRRELYDWWVANSSDQTAFNQKYKECILGEFKADAFGRGSDMQIAKSYGKKLIAYEGGNHTLYGCTNEPEKTTPPGSPPAPLTGPAELNFTGAIYPQYVTDHPFIFRIAEADKSTEIAEVYNVIIDSMKQAGMPLANHLSFAGRSSCYGVWHFIDATDMDEDTTFLFNKYPKFKAYSDRIKSENCTDVFVDLPTYNVGSGLALRLDGFNDYINLNNTPFKPDESGDYTIETWFKLYDLDTVRTIFSSQNSSNYSQNQSIYVRMDKRIIWETANGATVIRLSGPAVELKNWIHVAITKLGSRYTLYINGKDVASTSATITPSTKNQFQIGVNRNAGGMFHHLRGEIDEFRIWAVARSVSDIRDFMCKKTPTSPVPAGLTGYYRFDNGGNQVSTPNYVNVATPAILTNILFSDRSSYIVSGAPIGDISRNRYETNWSGVTLNFNHPDGDLVGVSNLGQGTPDGVHIYWVNGESYYNDPPLGYWGAANNKMFGVFMANGNNPIYDLTYLYQGNSAATGSYAEDNLRLLRKIENTEVRWVHAGAKLDKATKSLVVLCKETRKGLYNIGYRSDIKRPGAGMAIKYNVTSQDGTKSGKSSFTPYFTDYTITFWAKGNGVPFRLSRTAGVGGEEWSSINLDGARVQMNFRQDATAYSTPNYGDSDKWYHYAVVRRGTNVKLYINGVEIQSRDFVETYSYNQVEILCPPNWAGAQNLELDEFTVFNTALPVHTLRDWMCKKLTREHPNACNILLYFSFDEGAGIRLEDKYGETDMVLSPSTYTFVPSGAALGDQSTHNYTTPSSIQMTHPNGDKLIATGTSGTPFGVHLYRIDNMAPIPTTSVDPNIKAIDSTRHWGLYVCNPINVNSNYTIRYNWDGHAFVLNQPALRLLNRVDNSSGNWQNPAQTISLAAKTITITGQTRQEYLLAGTALGTFLFNAPNPPVFTSIVGVTNLTTICGNATNLRFKVIRDGLASSYFWTLPAELDGFSTGDSIIVNANYTGTTTKTVFISVSGVNSFGRSTVNTRSVTILPPPTQADAGPDLFILPPATSAVMAANVPNSGETGVWSVTQGTSVPASVNSPTSTINNLSNGNNRLVWSISQNSGLCPSSRDTIRIVLSPPPLSITSQSGGPLPLSLCLNQTITAVATPPDDIVPTGYNWSVPSGFRIISTSGNTAVIMATLAGANGRLSAASNYSGNLSIATLSTLLSTKPLPGKPVFINPPSLLCRGVNSTLTLALDASIDSVRWSLPSGISPTSFPISTSNTISVNPTITTTGFIKATAFFEGCGSSSATDSIVITVQNAPAMPIVFGTTNGGTADEVCNDEAIYAIQNPRSDVEYVWEWDANIRLIEYFGSNKRAARFDVPNSNSNVYVYARTSDNGCNESQKFNVNTWNRNESGYISDPITLTSPIGAVVNSLTVNGIYTFVTTCTSCPTGPSHVTRWQHRFFWDAPEGTTIQTDANAFDRSMTLQVNQEFSGNIRVWAITLKGCVKEASTLTISTPNGVATPTFVSGNTTICAGNMTNIQVSNVGADNYIWTLPIGLTYTTVSPILAITVTQGMVGNITVRAFKNGIFSSALRIPFRVNVLNIQPTTFYDINGNILTSLQVCEGANQERVFIKDVFAREYIWDNPPMNVFQFWPRFADVDINDNGIIDSGETGRETPRSTRTDTVIVYDYTPWRNKNGNFLKVISRNGCGGQPRRDSIPYEYATNPSVQIPEFEVAPTQVCVGSSVVYRIKPIKNATKYVWNLPSGLSAPSLETSSPEITVTVSNGTGGRVQVHGVSNVCGGGNTVTQQTEPIVISGEPLNFNFTLAPTQACVGQSVTFRVNDIGVPSYTWNLPGALSERIVDNSNASPSFILVNTGSGSNWTVETITGAGMINGTSIRIDNNTPSPKRAIYSVTVPSTGFYKVYGSYTTVWDNSGAVNFSVKHALGVADLVIDQRVAPIGDGIWHLLGTFYFNTTSAGVVEVLSHNNGNVSRADAIRFVQDGLIAGNEVTFPVVAGANGPVCVTAPIPACPSGYTICTNSLNLNGTLPNPAYTIQTNIVCENRDYTYSVTDIGANSYTWILPSGWSIGGMFGTVTGLSNSVTVRTGPDLGIPVRVSVFGVSTTCGLVNTNVIQTNAITYANNCVLSNPVYTQAPTSLCQYAPVIYQVNPVPFATAYVWTLPSGIVEHTSGTTNVFTTSSAFITISGVSVGVQGVIGVRSAHPSILGSAFVYSTNAITVTGANIPTAQIIPTATTICSGQMVTFTGLVTNPGPNPAYDWWINGVNQGINSATLITNGINSSTTVQFRLQSNAVCALPTAVTTTIGMTVIGTVTPTISITPSTLSLCSGQLLTVTSSGTNGGTMPITRWLRNGTHTGIMGSVFTTTSWTDGDQISALYISDLTCASVATVTSSAFVITVSPTFNPGIQTTSNFFESCVGSTIIVTPVLTQTGSNYTVHWFNNGSSVVGTINGYTTTGVAGVHTISGLLSVSGQCFSQLTTTSAIVVTINPNISPSFDIQASNAIICPATPITFTGVQTTSGISAHFTWFKNTTVIGIGNTIVHNDFGDGNLVRAIVSVSGTCLSHTTFTTAGIVITVNLGFTPSISISKNPAGSIICFGNASTFTGVFNGGGSTPVVNWYVNGVYSHTGFTWAPHNLSDISTITSELISSENCVSTSTVTSSAFVVTVNPILSPNITISGSAWSICQGQEITITATNLHGGTSPNYVWLVNGISISGQNTSVFITNSLTGQSTIQGVLMSSEACISSAQVYSNNLVVTVTSNVPPIASMQVSPGLSFCSGQAVTFAGIHTFAGASPTLNWARNSVWTSAATNWVTTLPSGLSTITLSVTSENLCASPRTQATSLVVTVNSTISPTVSIASNLIMPVCAGIALNFTVVGTNIGASTSITWLRNSVPMAFNQTQYSVFNPSNLDQIRVLVTPSGSCLNEIAEALFVISTTSAPANPVIGYTNGVNGNMYCKSNSGNPIPTLSGVGGFFESSTLVFANTLTGEVSLAASNTGSHTVVYRIPAGQCPEQQANATVIISQPHGMITYTPNILEVCTHHTGLISIGSNAISITGTNQDATTFMWMARNGSEGLNFISNHAFSPSNSVARVPLYQTVISVNPNFGCAGYTITGPSIRVKEAYTVAGWGYRASDICLWSGISVLNPSFTQTAPGAYFVSKTEGLSVASDGSLNLADKVPGIYTIMYTVPGTLGCPGLSADTTIRLHAFDENIRLTSASSLICNSEGSIGLDIENRPIWARSVMYPAFVSGNRVVNGNIFFESNFAGILTTTATLSGSSFCNFITNAISITVTGAPVPSTISAVDSIICKNATVQISNSASHTSGYFESNPAGLSISGAGDFIGSASKVGVYTLSYKVPAINACSAVESNVIRIEIKGAKPGVVFNSSPISPKCSGSGDTLLLLESEGRVQWQYKSESSWEAMPDTNQILILPSVASTTAYRAKVISALCPSAPEYTDSIWVYRDGISKAEHLWVISPENGMLNDTMTICNDPKVVLTISGLQGKVTKWEYLSKNAATDTTLWVSFGGTKDTLPTIQIPEIKGYGSRYWYRAEVKNGVCPSTITGIAIIKTCDRQLDIPNALAPTANDLNARWRLDRLRLRDNAEVRVFSRYGTLVYKANGKEVNTNPWDGGGLPAGTYYYVINFNDGELENRMGSVTIVR